MLGEQGGMSWGGGQCSYGCGDQKGDSLREKKLPLNLLVRVPRDL